MSKNNRPHNKHTPYKLEASSVIYGCYAKLHQAVIIGQSLDGYWCVRDLQDNIVAEA